MKVSVLGVSVSCVVRSRASLLPATAAAMLFAAPMVDPRPSDAPVAPSIADEPQAEGPGWILRDGVYTDFVMPEGFVVAPDPALARVLVGDELRSVSTKADVGVVLLDGRASLLVERTTLRMPIPVHVDFLAARSAPPEGVPVESSSRRCFGKERRFETWTVEGEQGAVRRHVATFLEDESFWRVSARHRLDDEEAAARIGDLAAALQPLDPQAGKALRTRQSEHPVCGAATIDEQLVWRQGVFADYRVGVGLRIPAERFFRGAAGSRLEGSAVLSGRFPRSGIELTLRYDEAVGYTAEEYHAASVRACLDGKDEAKIGETEVLANDGLDVRVTRTTYRRGAGSFVRLVATTVRGEIGVDLLLDGMAVGFDACLNDHVAVLGGLVGHDLEPTETRDDRYVDRRFGIEVARAEGLDVEARPHPQLGDRGATVSVHEEGSERAAVTAIWLPRADVDAVSRMRASFAKRLEGTGDGGALEWGTGVFAGRETMRAAFAGGLGPGEVHVFATDGVAYIAMVFGDDATRARVAGAFSLVSPLSD